MPMGARMRHVFTLIPAELSGELRDAVELVLLDIKLLLELAVF